MYRSLLLLVLSTLVIGCTESSREKATGKVDIRAINAIVGAPNATFLIEERSLNAAAFKSSIPAERFDDLSYNFRFELRLPAEPNPRVLARQFVDVERDHDYVFVLDGTVQNSQIRVWDSENREWDGSETVFELVFAHLNDTLGAVDLYFAAPGTAPSAGNEIATLENGDRLDAIEFPEGDYELVLTPPGEPQTVLYTSGERTYAPATTDMVVIFDKDPSVTGDINLRQFAENGSSVEMSDPRFPPQVQFVHAAFGTGNVDIAEDGNFTPPLVSDQAFGERTADVDVAAGSTDYTYTDTGNMGAILVETTNNNSPGLHFVRLLMGTPGDLSVLNLIADRRSFATNPRVAMIHVASNFDAIDIYLLPAGETVADNNPTFFDVPIEFATGLQPFPSDDYELTLTLPGEETIIAGPLAMDLAAGDVVEILILDTADPNVAEVQLLDLAP